MAQTTIEVEAEPVVVDGKTDSRGRITLGSDYADKPVKVAVIESGDESSS